MKIRGEVVAFDSTHTAYATWAFEAMAFRGTGAASTLVYTAPTANPETLTLGPSDITSQRPIGSASAWVLNVSADTTNGAIDLKVTGESGVTINWGAKLESIEVIH